MLITIQIQFFLKPFLPTETITEMRNNILISALAVAAGSLAADCNGHAELCDRQYSKVTFVGAHNSPFVGVGPADNQLTDPTEQLDLGVRFLQAQTQEKDGSPQMCHTSW